MSNKAGRARRDSGARDGSPERRGRGPNSGSARSRGERRAVEAAPWRSQGSGLPEFEPGALDAAAILKAVNEALLPVVEKELGEASERLGATLAEHGTGADLISVFRAELMRRVLPQFTEAVRAGVMEGIRTRQMHLAQLAVLHRQGLEAKTMQVVLTRLEHEAARAGLQIVGDEGDHSLFNVVEEQQGVMNKGPVTFELVVPAYVDKESGKLVERGWLRAVSETPPPVPTADKTKPGQKRRATHTETSSKQKRDAKESAGDAQPRKRPHRGQGAGGPSRERTETRRTTSRSETDRATTSAGSKAAEGQPAREGVPGGTAAPRRVKTDGRAPQEQGFKKALRAAVGKQRMQRGTR
ncbi:MULTISPECIES: hypothetical protein [unclassified Streptomyces]|uniref:hypothetical protein n=1 Tax=Streptomyces sp. SS1-1 TaxID=2651869 RepID=UPI0012505CF1|nr:hypothetical protein [Streptomyces sp. SS1-1]KAB2975742.1 hypothetical protein F8R89_29370 [Streptomyces sp. SS1-1]